MARYAPGGVPTSPELPDTQRWLREELEQVRNSTDDIYTLLAFLIDNYVVAGYGSIGQSGEVPLADIGIAWQTLQFDVELVTPPRNVGYDLAANGMIIETLGIWRMNATIPITFVELNAGRRIEMRLFNLTNGTPIGSPVEFAVGRNTDGVNLNLSGMFDVPEAGIGDTLVLQISSATDAFTVVEQIGGIWDANHVSEYKGTFALDSQKIKLRAA